MLADLLSYYENVETKEGLPEIVEHHFKRKLPLLKDEKKASSQWEITKYYLDIHDIDVASQRILDVGCGTGYTSIYFASAGAKEVVGVDSRLSKIEAFKAFISFLPEDVRTRIKVVRSSITNIEYKDYFDIVFAQEAISHIVDEAIFERLFKMLRTNGVLYITDGNNMLCKKYKNLIFEYWDRCENGPPGVIVGCHTDVGVAYKDIRKKLIQKWFGDKLGKDEINILTNNTAYLYGDSLRETCELYIQNRVFPMQKYIYGTCPIQPEHGYYMEKIFNPYVLRKKLLDIGFTKCFLYGSSGLKRHNIIRQVLKLTPLRIKYRIGKFFAVVAFK